MRWRRLGNGGGYGCYVVRFTAYGVLHEHSPIGKGPHDYNILWKRNEHLK